MKLLFDLRATQPNDSGKRHGGGRYGEVIFFRMVEMGVTFSCFYDSRVWFNPDVRTVVERQRIPLFDLAERSVQEIIKAEGFDRVYSCLPKLDIMHLRGCQAYGTIHGLRSLETPWDDCFWQYKIPTYERMKFVLKRHFPRWWRKKEEWKFRRKFANTDAKIVVVSEHTKQAVKAFFPEMKDRELRVFYSPNTSTGSAERIDTGERYFLAVSGNRWEKNNGRAIEAFDRLLSEGLIEGVRMKITGAKRENIYYKLRNPEAFDFLGYVSDQELERLYAGAYLFVYPSLNEGFGYPPLEAMRYGVPVIASPLSSMAEVCDQGALYFNPFLTEEIMGRMLMMMEPETHAAFSRRGHEQYLKISARQKEDLDGLIRYITE